MWPVAKFVPKKMKGQLELIEQKRSMSDNAWALPVSLLCSSRTSDEKRYCNHPRHHRAKREEAPKENRKHHKDRKRKCKRSSFSSEARWAIPARQSRAKTLYCQKLQDPSGSKISPKKNWMNRNFPFFKPSNGKEALHQGSQLSNIPTCKSLSELR